MISLTVFFLCYAGFVLVPRHKTPIALLGAGAVIALGPLSFMAAYKEIHWNVIGLFVGTLFLAELFMHSRVPAVIAEWLVDRTKTVRMALVSIFALASVISMFVENVAVVLLIAPVSLALCAKFDISPIKPLLLLAMFSNLQGTATLIGDPPSMILSSYMKLNFMDFFFYQGKPSVFFVVQAGMLSTLALSFWIFREQSQTTKLINIETARSWVPSVLLLLLIVILALSSSVDKDSTWLAGTTAMLLGVAGLVWQHFFPQWKSTWGIVSSLDWETVFFLVGLFILVGGIRADGWMDSLGTWITLHFDSDPLPLYLFMIGISIVVSAFVDNVPYLLTMIPVVQQIAAAEGMPLPLLAFGLLVGTCLGGNITPIGASANIVAVSFLEKNGYKVTYKTFVPTGLVFTACAVIPAAALLWAIWS